MTYKKIQESYKELYGTTVKSCWIADVKSELGLTTRLAYNRINAETAKYPCPTELIRGRLNEIIHE
jgi:hypothetical protein